MVFIGVKSLHYPYIGGFQDPAKKKKEPKKKKYVRMYIYQAIKTHSRVFIAYIKRYTRVFYSKTLVYFYISFCQNNLSIS